MGTMGAGTKLGIMFGGVGLAGGGGTRVGNNSRGKSSAAIQVSSAPGVEASTARLKPITHSEKRTGRRLRRQ
jgi:hypothetical protein